MQNIALLDPHAALLGTTGWGSMHQMDERVDRLTRLLRASDDGFWRSLREALVLQGVDPARSHLAASSAEGDDSEFGVLVTETAAVVQYLWQPSSSSFVEWVPITSWWHDSPYRTEIEAAMRAASQSAI